MNITIKLISLIPYQHSEEDGDELYIKLRGKRIWPMIKKFQYVKTEKQPVGITINVPTSNGSLDFELWEYDNFLLKQCLGVFKILADKKGGPYEASLIRKGKAFCNYSLQWEAI